MNAWMNARMDERMIACMNERVNAWMNEKMHAWTHEWINERINAELIREFINAWMNARMNESINTWLNYAWMHEWINNTWKYYTLEGHGLCLSEYFWPPNLLQTKKKYVIFVWFLSWYIWLIFNLLIREFSLLPEFGAWASAPRRGGSSARWWSCRPPSGRSGSTNLQ